MQTVSFDMSRRCTPIYTVLLTHKPISSSGKMMKLLLSSLFDRYRGVPVQIMFIVLVLFLMPDGSSSSSDVATGYRLNRKFSPYLKLYDTKSYVVIFDGGSSGSRVHVYCFDQNLELVPIGEEIDVYAETKPGLSAFASDPQAAANSLTSLLDTAQSAVPQDLQPTTPIKLGATAGLRQLEVGVSERILEAVRDLFKNKSAFKYKPEWVIVLAGSQEGSYAWVSINYLVGNLGKKYSNTFGMIDLGGGSVQMAYAISEKAAANAPTVPDGEDKYVNEMYLMGRKYFIYVHSYLNYGLLAARAEILKVTGDDYNPCILAGYDGVYEYGDNEYKASALPSGSNIEKCRRAAIKALRVNDTCPYEKCTFAGIWNGGCGDGQKDMYVASFLYDKAAEVGFISEDEPTAKVCPADFLTAAKRACQTKFKDAKAMYPRVDESDLPYLCMDLVYQYTLLVVGFGFDAQQKITLVREIKYKNALVGATWPLGSAIETISSS